MKLAWWKWCGEVLWLLSYGEEVEGRTSSFLGRNVVLCVCEKSRMSKHDFAFWWFHSPIIYRVLTNSRITDTRCNRTDCSRKLWNMHINRSGGNYTDIWQSVYVVCSLVFFSDAVSVKVLCSLLSRGLTWKNAIYLQHMIYTRCFGSYICYHRNGK
jgi:hypothetical protein